jgi:hypothetical protein
MHACIVIAVAAVAGAKYARSAGELAGKWETASLQGDYARNETVHERCSARKDST